MRNKLLENKKVMEENSYELWKGNGADMEAVSKAIQETAEIIVGISENLSDEDKLTTLQYVRTGLSDYENANNKRDDFLMADCLYYIWREITTIYIDALGE